MARRAQAQAWGPAWKGESSPDRKPPRSSSAQTRARRLGLILSGSPRPPRSASGSCSAPSRGCVGGSRPLRLLAARGACGPGGSHRPAALGSPRPPLPAPLCGAHSASDPGSGGDAAAPRSEPHAGGRPGPEAALSWKTFWLFVYIGGAALPATWLSPRADSAPAALTICGWWWLLGMLVSWKNVLSAVCGQARRQGGG